MGKQNPFSFIIKVLRVMRPSIRRSWATLIICLIYAHSGLLINWQVDQQMWIPLAILSWVISIQSWVKGNLALDLCFASFIYIPLWFFLTPVFNSSPFPHSLHSLQILGLQQNNHISREPCSRISFICVWPRHVLHGNTFKIEYECRLASLSVRIWTCPTRRSCLVITIWKLNHTL